MKGLDLAGSQIQSLLELAVHLAAGRGHLCWGNLQLPDGQIGGIELTPVTDYGFITLFADGFHNLLDEPDILSAKSQSSPYDALQSFFCGFGWELVYLH